MAEETLTDLTERLEVTCPKYARPTTHILLNRSRVGVSVEVCDPADPTVPKGAIYCVKRIIVEDNKDIRIDNNPPYQQRVYLDRDGFVFESD
jgi:hypothetical protein